MKKFKFAHYLVVLMIMVFAASCGKSLDKVVSTTSQSDAKYVGSEKCGQCHQAYYSDFIRSGHPWKLRKNGTEINGVDVISEAAFFGLPPIKDEVSRHFNFSGGGASITTTDGTNYTYDLKSWDDITYVIGGYKWKARFINKDGYVVTGDATTSKVQYNLGYNVSSTSEAGASSAFAANWSTYNQGKQKKFNCGPCHTSVYDPTGTENASMTGLKGSWEFEGIQCEECHGAGSRHVENRETLVKDDSVAACGRCHQRYWEETVTSANGGWGDSSTNSGWVDPASKGFSTWRDYAKDAVSSSATLASYVIVASSTANAQYLGHHEQYEDFLSSPHDGYLKCTTCHDPHKKSSESIKVTCEECHKKTATDFAISKHKFGGVSCIDCHMPFTGKSALADTSGYYKGDVRSHLLAYKTSPKDGSSTLTVANLYTAADWVVSGATSVTTETETTQKGDSAKRAYIPWEFACKRCHKDATAADFVTYKSCWKMHTMSEKVAGCSTVPWVVKAVKIKADNLSTSEDD